MFENWAHEIRVDDVWTCEPRTFEQVVRIANWAAARGWRVRPVGARHGWVPTTVVPGQPAEAEMVLLDMTAHLNKIVRVNVATKAITAHAGASMDDVMQALQDVGLGLTSIPAPGDVTLGGVLAIDGHGAAMPAKGENTAGRSYGSISNRVVSLKAVVWDNGTKRFVLKEFTRDMAVTKAMLVSLGRVMIVEATLRAETNVYLQCRSITDITAEELFAAPDNAQGKRTFASFIDHAGRVEAIWFAFTDTPWLKYWKVESTQPPGTRKVTKPYNYVFSDNIPQPIARMADAIVAGNGDLTPTFGKFALRASKAGLKATNTENLWGPSRATLHYIKPTTLRATDWGWVVLTKREHIQRVAHEFVTKHSQLVEDYRARGLYPWNISLELRCTGLDYAADAGTPSAEVPSLSALAPRADHQEWDTAIWLNLMSLPRTPGEHVFRRDLERWLFATYTGDYATVRAEWTKNWGYTDQGCWKNTTVLREFVPNSFRYARTKDNGWDWAMQRLYELDPRRVFSNEFLDDLLR